MALKLCSCCKLEKDKLEFYKNKSKEDGLSNQCKECYKNYHNTNRDIILTKQKDHYQKIKTFNKIKLDGKKCSSCKEYKSIDNFNITNCTKSGYYSQCKICQYKSEKLFVKNNREKINFLHREYYKKRIKKDPFYRLKLFVNICILRTFRKNKFLTEKLKQTTNMVYSFLPYSVEELKQHIESLWEDWMSWENYGPCNKNYRTWQIDHIIPQSRLPFKSFEDENFKRCWSLENLRPLDSYENLIKRDKI